MISLKIEGMAKGTNFNFQPSSDLKAGGMVSKLETPV
jgi:hypothetical protein